MKLGFKNFYILILLNTLIILSGCTETELIVHTAKKVQSDIITASPKGKGVYKVGKPYQIFGKWYYPAEELDYSETGIASWYGPKFHGKLTANGELFDQNLITAAHRTLPMPSAVRITNLENGRALNIRVNDRGPFARGRIIDVSRRGAQLLGFERKGTTKVKVEFLSKESRNLKIEALNNKIMKGNQPKINPSPRLTVVSKSVNSKEITNSLSKDVLDNIKTRKKYSAPPLSKTVNVLPVIPSEIYVQTGTFSKLQYALRMRDKVYKIGPTQISRHTIGGNELFRVRIGPMDNIDAADKTLLQLAKSGVVDARLVVE
ncbi:MAG: septal ring lytic transglycosylase RlpA family protein [Alphaproteobacteria bacterium]|nr:septal ring lytic transglycosylase RlpA family protein [Alphaproteobacteria bacterium]